MVIVGAWKNDCAKLCHLFCDVDNVTYGELEKIGFTRTKTLGYGGDCCDFHFSKNSLYTLINLCIGKSQDNLM